MAAAFAEHGDRIACLITEAAPGNMGVVPPLPGFNAFLAETCAAHGALFVSDEVMTGFRASKLGQWGLDGAVEGWKPDLMTFGKVMGGGLPAAAFGGRADVMSQLAPEGPVYQAGTLSGNPVATTAGLATLRLATDEVYDRLSLVADTLRTAAGKALTEAGVPHVVQSTGTMFSVFFTGEPVPRLRRRVDPGHRRVRRLLPRHARREACTCPPRRTRRGSSPAPTTTARSRPSSTRSPTPPRRPPRPERPLDDRPSTGTIVHVLRHGEVHNPEGILYGRRPGYHLSELGRAMAERVAESVR